MIAKYPDDYEPLPSSDPESRVTYYYVSHPPPSTSPNLGPGGYLDAADAGANAPGQGVGGPDGGRAQRQVQRGPSYGTLPRERRVSDAGQQQQAGGQAQGQGQGQGEGPSAPPPSYGEAIRGDHKVQGP